MLHLAVCYQRQVADPALVAAEPVTETNLYLPHVLRGEVGFDVAGGWLARQSPAVQKVQHLSNSAQLCHLYSDKRVVKMLQQIQHTCDQMLLNFFCFEEPFPQILPGARLWQPA